ncbi:hypothetical protein D3C72_1394970 [compost metagenome]
MAGGKRLRAIQVSDCTGHSQRPVQRPRRSRQTAHGLQQQPPGVGVHGAELIQFGPGQPSIELALPSQLTLPAPDHPRPDRV